MRFVVTGMAYCRWRVTNLSFENWFSGDGRRQGVVNSHGFLHTELLPPLYSHMITRAISINTKKRLFVTELAMFIKKLKKLRLDAVFLY